MTSHSASDWLGAGLHWLSVLLATGVVLWSALFLSWVARNVVVSDHGFSTLSVLILIIVALPLLAAVLLYRGAVDRNRSLVSWCAVAYTASILMPALAGLAYVPAILAAWLSAWLMYGDRRRLPRDGVPARLHRWRGYPMY